MATKKPSKKAPTAPGIFGIPEFDKFLAERKAEARRAQSVSSRAALPEWARYETYNQDFAKTNWTGGLRPSQQMFAPPQGAGKDVMQNYFRDAKTGKLFSDVEVQRQRATALGAKLPEETKRPGAWSRLLDVLSRGNYAVAEAVRRADEYSDKVNRPGFSLGEMKDQFLQGMKGLGSGAVSGAAGKSKTTFSDVIRFAAPNWSKNNRAATAVTGFVGDVAFDPLNLVGLGLITKAGKGGAAAVKQIDKVIEAPAVKTVLSDADKAMLKRQAYTSGEVSKAFAKTLQPKVDEIIHRTAKIKGEEVAAELIAKGVDPKKAVAAGQVAKGNTFKDLLDSSQQILDQTRKRTLALSVGTGAAKIKVPVGLPLPSLLAAKAASRTPDRVRKAADGFAEKFNNSTKIFPEMQQLRLEHRASAVSRIEMRTRMLRSALTHLGHKGREAALEDALNGVHSGAGATVKVGDVDEDAAKWIRDRINATALSVDEAGLTPDDLNRYMRLHGYKFPKPTRKTKNDNWIMSGLKEAFEQGRVRDAGDAIFQLESAFEQAVATKSMLKSFGENFGVRGEHEFDFKLGKDKAGKKVIIKTPKPDGARAYQNAARLKAEGWRSVDSKKIPELKDHIFPADVATGIERIMNVINDEQQMNKFLQKINNLTGEWKFLVTVPNPGFHVRNSIGDWIVNHIDAVSPEAYRKAADLVHKSAAKYERSDPSQGLSPLTLLQDPLEQAVTYKSGIQKGFGRYKKEFIDNRKAKLKSADGSTNDWLTEGEIRAGYDNFGLRQNYSLSEFGEYFAPESQYRAMRGYRASRDKMVEWSEKREDYFRMAHFIHLIQSNPSKAKTVEEAMRYAAQRVRQTHFDYSDFTLFEKRIMSNLIPFYKWTRKALPLQIQYLFTNPGRLMTVPKFTRAMSELTGNDFEDYDYMKSEAVVPVWMRSSGYLPVGKGGMEEDQKYLNIANPFGDVFRQFGGTSLSPSDVPGEVKGNVISMINPAFRVGLEGTFNKQAFTGAPIVNRESDTRSTPYELGRYASSQLPFTNAMWQTFQSGLPEQSRWSGNQMALASWLTGLGLTENTEGRKKSELMRQQDVIEAQYRKLAEEYRKRRGLPEGARLYRSGDVYPYR